MRLAAQARGLPPIKNEKCFVSVLIWGAQRPQRKLLTSLCEERHMMSSEMFPLPKGNRKSTNGHKGGCKRTWAEMPFLGRAWAQVASPTDGAQTLQGLTRTFWWVWGPPEQWSFVLYFPKETWGPREASSPGWLKAMNQQCWVMCPGKLPWQ